MGEVHVPAAPLGVQPDGHRDPFEQRGLAAPVLAHQEGDRRGKRQPLKPRQRRNRKRKLLRIARHTLYANFSDIPSHCTPPPDS